MIFVLNRRLESVIEKITAVALKLQAITFILGGIWFIIALLIGSLLIGSDKQSMYDNMSNASMVMVVSFSILMTSWLIRFLFGLYIKPDFIITSDNKYYTISIDHKADLSKIVQQDDFRQTVQSLIDKMEKDRQTKVYADIQFGTVRLQQYKQWKICIETKNNEKIVGIDKRDRDGQWLSRERYREKQLAKTSIDSMGLSKLRIGTWDDLINMANKEITG